MTTILYYLLGRLLAIMVDDGYARREYDGNDSGLLSPEAEAAFWRGYEAQRRARAWGAWAIAGRIATRVIAWGK